jgi:hypothetical protein
MGLMVGSWRLTVLIAAIPFKKTVLFTARRFQRNSTKGNFGCVVTSTGIEQKPLTACYRLRDLSKRPNASRATMNTPTRIPEST